jgi:hypothetical protein
MSVYKLAAGLAALLCCAAVVTAMANVRSAPVKAAAVKGDRLDIRSGVPQCSPEPWPFGCQWRDTPTRRLTRNP